MAEGLLSKDEVKVRMEKLREREGHIEVRLLDIEHQVSSVPDPAKVKRLSELGQKVLKNMTTQQPEKIFSKSYEWKRNLVDHAFGGRDAESRRLGVYVEETEGA